MEAVGRVELILVLGQELHTPMPYIFVASTASPAVSGLTNILALKWPRPVYHTPSEIYAQIDVSPRVRESHMHGSLSIYCQSPDLSQYFVPVGDRRQIHDRRHTARGGRRSSDTSDVISVSEEMTTLVQAAGA
jgi:hypothetical protein